MVHESDGTGLFPASRLRQVAAAAGSAGLDALLLTPGPDLRYVTGYDAHQLERLTCLVVPAGTGAGGDDPFLVVPRLEVPAAQASPAGQLDLEIVGWDETDDPYALVARRLGAVTAVGLSDRMWALMVLRMRAAMPAVRQELASTALRDLRARKSAAEVAALLAAGEAIDSVHAQVPGWLRPGRTEREVAADISDAILAAGHVSVDFAIVASGPNGASPHHTAADRVLQPGDAVVVDIGGTMPTGYCSDCTRTYAIGAPPADFAAYYQVLKDAQEAACAAVRPGVTGRGRGRGSPRADRRGRLRRVLRAPDRARHRAGDARGSVHRVRQRRDPAARTRVLGRAGNLSGPARRAHRGHRGLHRVGCQRLNNVTRDLVVVTG